MTTRKPPPSQLELKFAAKPAPANAARVIEMGPARARIQQRQRGSLYESIISRAAHLLGSTPRAEKK
jgi:hypothetical protein